MLNVCLHICTYEYDCYKWPVYLNCKLVINSWIYYVNSNCKVFKICEYHFYKLFSFRKEICLFESSLWNWAILKTSTWKILTLNIFFKFQPVAGKAVKIRMLSLKKGGKYFILIKENNLLAQRSSNWTSFYGEPTSTSNSSRHCEDPRRNKTACPEGVILNFVCTTESSGESFKIPTP